MKTALRRIFGSSAVSEIPDAPKIKSEPAFVTTTESQQIENEEIEENCYWGSRGRGTRGRPFVKRGNMRGNYRGRQKTGTNPLNNNGFITTCSICGSRYHWKRDCRENPENKKEEPRGYLTFATIPELVTKECMKIGIIDTGCTMTVAGEPWYQAFNSSVSFKINEGRPDKTSFLVMARKFSVDEISRYLLQLEISTVLYRLR